MAPRTIGRTTVALVKVERVPPPVPTVDQGLRSLQGAVPLVVWLDDEIEDCHYWLSHLLLNGYGVFPVRTIDEFRSMGLRVPADIVLLDYRLRSSGTGIDALRSLLATLPDARVAFVTDHVDRLARELPDDLSTVPVLAKEDLRGISPGDTDSALLDFLRSPPETAQVAPSISSRLSAIREHVQQGQSGPLQWTWSRLKNASAEWSARLLPIALIGANLLPAIEPTLGELAFWRTVSVVLGVALIGTTWAIQALYFPALLKRLGGSEVSAEERRELVTGDVRDAVARELEGRVHRSLIDSDFYLLEALEYLKEVEAPGRRRLATVTALLGYAALAWAPLYSFISVLLARIIG